MRIKRAISVLLIVLLTSYVSNALLGNFFVSRVKAQGEEVQVLPALNVYEIGQEFTVSIYVTYIEGLASWQLDLKFEPGVLFTNASLIDEGPFLKSSGAPTLFIEDVLSSTISLSCLITTYPGWVDGEGILATITFRVIGNGRSALSLSNPVFLDQDKLPTPIQPIPVDSVFYTTYPRARFYYLPSTTAPSEFTPFHLSRDPFVNETIWFNATAYISAQSFLGSYDPDTATQSNPAGTITNYIWNFDDGNVTSGSYPLITHSFTTTNTYEVNLTVTDGEGKSSWYVSRVQPIIRDVGLSIIEVSPHLANPGETISVKINITNYGTMPGTERVNVTLYQNNGISDTLIPYNVSRGLYAWSNVFETDPAGKTAPWQFMPGAPPITLNYTWQTGGLQAGNYTLWANISQVNLGASEFLKDLYFREMDLNLTNNTHVWGEVELRDIPNIAITEITLAPALKQPNIIDYGVNQVTVKIKVENTGGYDATFNVTLHQDSTLLFEWTDVFLASKTSTVLEYTWITSALPRGYTGLVAQASNITDEVANGRTGDNRLSLQVLATSAPVAVFTFSVTKPLVGDIIQIDASASHAAPGWSISSYTWRINDTIQKTYQDMANVEARFIERGPYNITLTVADNATVSSSFSQVIYVGYLPVAQFAFSPTAPKVDGAITFDASSSAPDTVAVEGDQITTYQWDFGDGAKTTYTGANLTKTTTHSYALSGNFTVKLKVFDGEDFNATVTKFVVVSKIASGVTTGMNAQTIQVGQSVTISGKVTPARAGVKVSILYKTATTDWTLLQNVTSDQAGNYQYAWIINTVGNYTVKARFAGDNKYASSESTTAAIEVEAIVETTPPDYTMYIIVGAVAVIIIVAAAAIYLIRRRK